MISSPDSEKSVEKVLKNPHHPAFSAMWKALAERGYGRVSQPITGDDGTPLIPSSIVLQIVRAK